MSKGNPFLALRLTRDQQDALRARAAAAGLTLSDLVRNVLADYLADARSHAAPPDAQPRRYAAAQAKRSRKPSRPVRLQHAIAEIEDLLAD